MLRGRADEQMPMLDSLAIGFNFGWIFGRLGCFFAHDHIGIASTAWIAVQFPDGPRLDLGLIECLFACALAVAFALLDKRAHPPGFFFEWYLVLYGAFRTVRGALEVNHTTYAGLIADQWVGLGLLSMGLLVRMVRCRKIKRGFSRPRLSKPL
jgi:phosphatidylglycerol:prolipoprotein diacylglycerol transferase